MGNACNCCEDTQINKDKRPSRKITHKHKPSIDDNKSESDGGNE